MVQMHHNPGICGARMYRSDCPCLRNSSKERKPVLHCEEFDNSEPRA